MQTNTAKFTGKPLAVVPDSTDAPSKPMQKRSIWSLLPALMSFSGLMALIMYLAPPASAELNLSFVGELFTSLFGAMEEIVPSFESFIDVGFPVLIKVIIYVAIITIIGLFLMFGRRVVEKIIEMIGF